MPNRDGTGPEGKGPKTGRGLGNCAGNQPKETIGQGLGRSLGQGLGRSLGQGLGRGRNQGRRRQAK
ncbi:hypothetical protein C4566_03210 [Candidatus Parcubacteria bacterium]|nr:MAG: hypothetical protein C4566_03210 [Candidatus Parcubacteria bacterium]